MSEGSAKIENIQGCADATELSEQEAEQIIGGGGDAAGKVDLNVFNFGGSGLASFGVIPAGQAIIKP
jgi:hypothetical protein